MLPPQLGQSRDAQQLNGTAKSLSVQVSHSLTLSFHQKERLKFELTKCHTDDARTSKICDINEVSLIGCYCNLETRHRSAVSRKRLQEALSRGRGGRYVCPLSHHYQNFNKSHVICHQFIGLHATCYNFIPTEPPIYSHCIIILSNFRLVSEVKEVSL